MKNETKTESEVARTPNDQRADVSNSNNQAPNHNNHDYKAMIDNRSNQLNPNNPKYMGKK